MFNTSNRNPVSIILFSNGSTHVSDPQLAGVYDRGPGGFYVWTSVWTSEEMQQELRKNQSVALRSGRLGSGAPWGTLFGTSQKEVPEKADKTNMFQLYVFDILEDMEDGVAG